MVSIHRRRLAHTVSGWHTRSVAGTHGAFAQRVVPMPRPSLSHWHRTSVPGCPGAQCTDRARSPAGHHSHSSRVGSSRGTLLPTKQARSPLAWCLRDLPTQPWQALTPHAKPSGREVCSRDPEPPHIQQHTLPLLVSNAEQSTQGSMKPHSSLGLEVLSVCTDS